MTMQATPQTTTLQASPTKLRDGSWGARTKGVPAIGDTITITTKAGKTWNAQVTSLVWTDQKVAIVSTKSLDRAPSTSTPRPSRRRFVPCGYPGCHPSYCDECDGEGMYGSSY